MGKFKDLAIEQYEDIDFERVMEEMWERNILAGAAELCRRGDYGYSKFLDELNKELNEARGKEA